MEAEGAEQRRRRRLDRLALPQDLAARRLVDAGEDLDDRRLAGAVLAEERMEAPGVELQVDLAERNRRAELLGEVAELEKGDAAGGGAARRGGRGSIGRYRSR
jgi:hypothetical protein